MRRRLLSAACALTLPLGLALVGAPADAAAVTTMIDGVTYQADDVASGSGATVTDVATTAPKALVLRNQVTIGGKTYAVTAVGESAADSLSLTSVTLPTGLRTIDDNAFAGNALTALTLPPAVTLIDTAAFAFNQIGQVTVPASVTAIGSGAFVVNPLTTVSFLGAPPTTFTPTGGRNVGSLGDDDDDGPGSGNAPTVYYTAPFAAPGFPGGFTAPVWQGYRSVAPATPPGSSVPPGTQPAPAPTRATLKVTKKKSGTSRAGLVRIKITVTNTGGTTAQKVRARVTNRPAGVSFPRRKATIGTLAPGASKTVTLKVRVGHRKAKLTVRTRSANATSVKQKVVVKRR